MIMRAAAVEGHSFFGAERAIQPIALTGDRPTGALHLGHLAGSLLERVAMQDHHRLIVMVADAQAQTDNAGDKGKIQKAIKEVALDYLAVGIDPARSIIFLQSEVPELFELTFHFMNLVTVARLERNPTIRQELKSRFGSNLAAGQELPASMPRQIPVGFLTYPVSQAADILAFGAQLVPVGEDQLPMIEQAQEIAVAFEQLTGERVFEIPKARLSNCPRLPGVDGSAKMSKSMGNALALGASADEVAAAVKKMYTDPNHLRVEDPGQVEGNVVFSYLDAFSPDAARVEELKARYRAGGLGDMAVKKELMAVLDALLAPIRERRAAYAQEVDVTAMLRAGSEIARSLAAERVARARKALGVGLLG